GVDLVVVAAGVPNQLNSDLDEHIGNRIRQLPGVRVVTPGLLELVEFEKGNSVVSVFIQGWQADNPGFTDLEIRAGRRLEANDGKVAMLGADVADNLKKQVGDTVEIQR